MGNAQLIRGDRIKLFYRRCDPAHIFKVEFLRLAQHDMAARNTIDVKDISSVAEFIRYDLGGAGGYLVGPGNA